ncbi:MAG: DUF3783 domain-containing protein [Spirochaetota bacterium]|nr:DUF3783 domain-containing protein [Spirochaetota bacterium]
MADRKKSEGPDINGGGPGDSAENGRSAEPDKHGSSDGNNVPADERMVLIHGFSRDETIAVMRAAKTAVSDPQGVAFTTSTPTNLDWKLRDLIVEVREEHEFMRRNPPGANQHGQARQSQSAAAGRPQQNPPRPDQAGGAGAAGQPDPQASDQKGDPDGQRPPAPGKDR